MRFRKVRVQISGGIPNTGRRFGDVVRDDDRRMLGVQFAFQYTGKGEYSVDLSCRLSASAFWGRLSSAGGFKMGLQAFYIDLLGLGGIHVEHARYTHLRRIRPDPRSLGVSSRRRNFNRRNGNPNNHSRIIRILRLQGEKMAIVFFARGQKSLQTAGIRAKLFL